MPVTITLKDGTTFHGTTPGDAIEAMKSLNLPTRSTHSPDKWYFSTSKREDILIEDMPNQYLKNALLKRYEIWLESLRLVTNFKDLVTSIYDGPADDRVFIGLLKELISRWS